MLMYLTIPRQIIMLAVDKPRTISFKGTTDLVTETDKNCEEAIIKVLLLSRHGRLTAPPSAATAVFVLNEAR